ncbi:hypothetical protein CF327_g7054 [Tilletia walkeri]|nr:hypothetical protein CF327_g7054 [Tilletia walkeri]
MKLVNLFILVALSSSLFTTCQAVECSECTDNACNILCVTCQGNSDDGYLPRTDLASATYPSLLGAFRTVGLDTAMRIHGLRHLTPCVRQRKEGKHAPYGSSRITNFSSSGGEGLAFRRLEK